MSKVKIIPHFQLQLEDGQTAILSREELFALREKIDRWLKRTLETGYHTVQACVAHNFGITVPELLSFNRSERLAYPRMVAQLLCREFLPDQSLDQIGAAFYRDHSAVGYAIKRAQDMISINAGFARKVEKCRATLSKEFAARKLSTEPDQPVPWGSPNGSPEP